MNLLIDLGNTNLKWALHSDGTLGEMRTVRHHGALPIDLHAAWEELSTPEQILLARVGADTLVDVLTRSCHSRWGREPRVVRVERRSHGVTVAYRDSERLGVDRWLALLAAHAHPSGPVLVVDAGTAITYDLLLADGRHLGGLILPGVEMMRGALRAGTQIPPVEVAECHAEWAADTASAIAAGSVQAPAALAEHLLHRLAAEAAERAELILTGGDAERLLRALRVPVRHQADLVLRGLALLLD
jgi:type III pantothenate kinase